MDSHTLIVLYHHNMNALLFILVTIYHKILLYAYFSDSRFAPCMRSSYIHSHNILLPFISNSTLFVGIVALTKMGEC